MKLRFLILIIFSFNAYSSEEITYKHCEAIGAEMTKGSNSIITCRIAYKDGKKIHTEVKVLTQTIDEETKKSAFSGTTILVP